ncbi:MBL fold metallo-hydrolase [Acinetobacter sp. MB5]|uniref:MBL fold metallo-hydrolase n=1 Tax=Acinetobacter sp. MB5 TaxID=2069438 RepID=UPI000DD03602|nr:MBL fold metallo-hydrolase [Acinetobacter sp. MB5]
MNHPEFKSHQIGDFLVTVLNDGEMNVSLTLLSGIDEKSAEKIQADAGVIHSELIDINCYLIQGKGHTILVDSGTGGLNNAGGLLLKNLGQLGVAPSDIDTILITHAHPDHIGGLLAENGHPIYPNAKLYLHTFEAEYWQNDQAYDQATERGKRNFDLVRRTLNAYAKCIDFFDENEVIEGIRPILLAGHTPGHTGFQIGSARSSILIWGDIVHFPNIQLTNPSVSIAFDYDQNQAKITREKLLQQVAEEKQLIAGMHIGKSGFAYIHSDEKTGGYKISYLEELHLTYG